MSAIADEFRLTMPHDVMRSWGGDAQIELRRLHALNAELLDALERIVKADDDGELSQDDIEAARAAIAKLEAK